MTTVARNRPIRTVGSWIGQGLGKIWNVIVSALDFFFATLQNILGVKRMPYVFVLPNLLIFGIFTTRRIHNLQDS